MEKKRFFVVKFYMVQEGWQHQAYVLAKNADLAICAVKKAFPPCLAATAYLATDFPSFDFKYYDENVNLKYYDEKGEAKILKIEMFGENLSKTLPDNF